MTGLRSTALASLAALVLLAGCAGGAPNVGANADNSHDTAATGYGLGPQNFNTNGGAFGPDQLDH